MTMLPREHGSWAVLVAPVLVGFAAAGEAPSGTVLLFSCAALGAFLLRTPLQSLLSPHPAAEARRWLLACSALAAAGGLPLLFWQGRWGLAGFALPAAGLMAYNIRSNLNRRALSAANELAGVLALCLGAPAAFYAARGALAWEAWESWALSALYFCGPIFHVKMAALEHRLAADRSVLAALERQRAASVAYHGAALSVVVAAAAAARAPALAALPFLAALHKTWRRARRPPGRMDFRRLGYQEMGYACFFALAASAGYLLRVR